MKTLKEALFSKDRLDKDHYIDPKFNSFYKLMNYNFSHPKETENLLFLYRFDGEDYYSPVLMLNIHNGKNYGLIEEFIRTIDSGIGVNYLIDNANAHAGFLCLKMWYHTKMYGFNLLTFDTSVSRMGFKSEYTNVEDISYIKDGKLLFDKIKDKFNDIPQGSIV